jgi:hypothetical protein
MTAKSLIVGFMFMFSLLSCENSDQEPFYPLDSFYFNSFETNSDTTGWYGISSEHIVEDAPKVGGKYSLEVSGGCVIPHAYYQFAPLSEDCSLVLKSWGKNLSNGGSIHLRIEDYSDHIGISVSEPEWTEYICEDTINCPAGSTLILELFSGGIISSAMRVDQIEITELN